MAVWGRASVVRDLMLSAGLPMESSSTAVSISLSRSPMLPTNVLTGSLPWLAATMLERGRDEATPFRSCALNSHASLELLTERLIQSRKEFIRKGWRQRLCAFQTEDDRVI